jgi:hypothetical protein
MTKPTAARNLAVRTPGAPAEAAEVTKPTAAALQDQMAAEEAALDAAVREDVAAGAQTADAPAPADASPALTAPDIQRLIDEGIARGVAKALAVQARAQASGTPSVELPDQSQVDAFAIRKEQLTKQGWVVPAVYPGQIRPAGTNLDN